MSKENMQNNTLNHKYCELENISSTMFSDIVFFNIGTNRLFLICDWRACYDCFIEIFNA